MTAQHSDHDNQERRRARARRRGRSAWPLVLSALLVPIVAAGCGGSASSAAAPDQSGSAGDLGKVTLRVGIQSSGSSVAKAILDESKVFEGTPYTVEWADFPGADQAVEALNAGAIDLDVGLNSSAPVFAQANARDPWTADSAPFKIIAASKAIDSQGIAIVVKKGAGIDSVAQLKGKKVSFAKGTANHYYFALAAKDAGIDAASAELVLMPLSEARAAFVGGAVDALVTAVSNARPLVRKNDAQILATSKGRFDTYSFVVARPPALADAGVQAATRDFLTRLQKANDWERQHREAVTQLYIDEAKQPAEDAKLSAEEGGSAYVALDDAVIAAQQDQAKVFADTGVAKTAVDVKAAFDERYATLFGKAGT
jgi:sulfonate transport system substrate-binding protein